MNCYFIATDGALSFRTVKHRLRVGLKGLHFQVIGLYSDSEMATKFCCARTKTEVTVKIVLSARPVHLAIQDLSEISFLGVSTDGSSHGSQELFPVVI
jgi:hypothetical protein